MTTPNRLALMGALLLIAPLAHAQAKTLADFLPTLKEQGPLIAIDAANLRPAKDKTGLPAYSRQKIKVGDLTAIVPTEMVVIDDSFRNPGSLTDGLPTETKLLYLLQSLTPEQWKRANGSGIGLSDLQGEQKDVFRSLLPKRVAWNTYRVKKDGIALEEVGKGEVPEDKLLDVRVRLTRSLEIETNLEDQASYTNHTTDLFRGKPGDLYLSREGQFEEGDTYGLEVKQRVPNVLKTAHLPYPDAAFEPLVDLKGTHTLREALAAIGQATGQEIHADLRVADLKVTLLNGPARARDLLKALALGVTGTYRRVGPAYVLSSDLMGHGTRKLRFALWWEDMRQRTHRLSEEWRKKIGDRADRVQFGGTDPFAPNASMQAHLAIQDETPNRDKISANELSPALRDYLNQINRHYPHQRIDTSKVRLESQLRFGFVLPDGRPLNLEYQPLGQRSQFETRPVHPRPEPPKIGLPIPLPEKVVPRLAIRTEAPAVAKSAVDFAHARGFRELWIETRSPAALAAALEAGKKHSLPIRLLLRPWNAPTPDLDRTILGDAGSQVATRLGDLDLWKTTTTYRPNESLVGTDRITPGDPSLPALWASYQTLAATPGIAGVVISEAVTPGYESPEKPPMGFSRAIAEARIFGYAANQRLAFLRRYGMDPVDIVGEDLMVGPDLRQPFFLDDELRGLPTTYDGRDVPNPKVALAHQQWREFRYKQANDAILTLLNDLAKAAPVAVSVLPARGQSAPFEGEILAPWKPGSPIPTLNALVPPIPGADPVTALTPFPKDPTDAQISGLFWLLKNDLLAPTLDLRNQAPGTWATLLDRWIKK